MAVLSDKDIEKLETLAVAGIALEPAHTHKLISTIRNQKRALEYLFSLFSPLDESGLRHAPHSIRHHNLTQLKRSVGMDDEHR